MSDDSSALKGNGVQCLALDMGGVVCADTWEALVMTPDIGLAAVHGLDRDRVHAVGTELWHRYAYAEHNEQDYWRDWERALGFAFDPMLIERLYATQLWSDPTAAGLVERCLNDNIRVAIVSNSTSFWFPRQMRLSGLDKMQDHLRLYLSHRIGQAKTHQRGGLRLLANAVAPETILFVDDRAENIAVAEALGMCTLFFAANRIDALREAVEPLLAAV